MLSVKFKISKKQHLSFSLKEEKTIAFHMKPHVTAISSGEIPVYTGRYFITPKVSTDVVLDTERKLMQKNVRVEKIPQFEVSNDSDGKTLIIGEEYYG